MNGLTFDEAVQGYATVAGLPLSVAREQMQRQLDLIGGPKTRMIWYKGLVVMQLNADIEPQIVTLASAMDFDSGMEDQYRAS